MEQDSLALAKARLSIATVKARNSGAAKVEVVADDVAVLIAAHSDPDRQVSLSTPKGSLPGRGEVESGTGWVAWNPDSGEEYTRDHPVTSGECVEAERIRPSTPQEDVLWEAFQEQFTRAEALAAALALAPAEAIRDGGEGGEG